MKDYGDLTALIVEPNVGMRGNLQNMLNQCNISKIEYAVSSGTAVRHLTKKSFDIIFCEYDLGAGQNGQQLLEDLRHNKLITQWTIFIIATSESVYGKVVSAAELAPTDYILKPFTIDMLQQRIVRAIRKRSDFFAIAQLMAHGNLRDAIKACATGEAKGSRHLVDFQRLRAELHLSLGEPAEAEQVYLKILEARFVGWAALGRAKTLFLQDRLVEAEEALTSLVAANGKFMDAYDWLSKTQEALGKLAEAQKVLAGAVAISPHVVRRLRKLGEIALDAGDTETAEKSLKQVVSIAKYSEFRDPEDHLLLVKTLLKKGDTSQAATVIRDLDKSLSGNDKTPVCHSIASAMLQQSLGKIENASEQFTAAAEICRDNRVGLSGKMQMGLVKSCLENKLDDAASDIMLSLIDDVGNGVSIAKAISVFVQEGRQDLADGMRNKIDRQVSGLISAGEDKAEQGDYRGAVVAMLEALHKAPDQPKVIYAAIAMLLKQLDILGWEHPLGEQARLLITNARSLAPSDPQVATLTNRYQAIQRKYGIAA